MLQIRFDCYVLQMYHLHSMHIVVCKSYDLQLEWTIVPIPTI